MARRPHSNDLFAIFPDLPYARRRGATDQVQNIPQQVEEFRRRARANIERQRAAAERVRAQVKQRKRRT